MKRQNYSDETVRLNRIALKDRSIFDQLVNLDGDEYHSAAAKTVDEARKLVEDGFEYICQKDDLILFRKRN